MFVQNISPFQRVCATCEFWNGLRKTDFMQMRVIIENAYNSYGVCMNLNSPFRRNNTGANNSCQFWSKWGILR